MTTSNRNKAVARAVKNWRKGKKSLTIYLDHQKDRDLIEWLDNSDFCKTELVIMALRRFKEGTRR